MQVLKHEASYYQTSAFKWRQRIGFGISDYACNLAYLVANTYLMFYYTNCAGINATAIGSMMVATRFIDAFTDYMIGVSIDRTDTKHGRYRPWMLAGGCTGACRRYGPGIRCPCRMERYSKAGMGISFLLHYVLWLHNGKYPDGSDCVRTFCRSCGAHENCHHPYRVFEPWIYDGVHVYPAPDLVLCRSQRCQFLQRRFRCGKSCRLPQHKHHPCRYRSDYPGNLFPDDRGDQPAVQAGTEVFFPG